MSRWKALYETPTLFSAEWGHHRIYAPVAYPSVRNALTVPITFQETLVVARYFPVCWQRVDHELRLTALVALQPGYFRMPAFDELPLAVRAYPFIVPEDLGPKVESLWIDRAIPDKPTDIGAPILLDDNTLSEGARLRINHALDAARALPATDDFTQDLEAHGLLEPWPLKFDLGAGGKIERKDLSVFSAAQYHNPALYKLIERHGAQAGVFLGLHRASLFRINWLLQALRSPPPSRPANSGEVEITL